MAGGHRGIRQKVASRLGGTADKISKAGTPERIAAQARGEGTVSAMAEVVERPPDEQAELVAQAARVVRDWAKPRREARAKKRGRSGKAARRPEGPVASAAGLDAVDEGLSPPPEWLESFPSRFRLANPAAFDYLAMLWGIAQALLPRIKPPYHDTKRIAHARYDVGPRSIVLAVRDEA